MEFDEVYNVPSIFQPFWAGSVPCNVIPLYAHKIPTPKWGFITTRTKGAENNCCQCTEEEKGCVERGRVTQPHPRGNLGGLSLAISHDNYHLKFRNIYKDTISLILTILFIVLEQ